MSINLALSLRRLIVKLSYLFRGQIHHQMNWLIALAHVMEKAWFLRTFVLLFQCDHRKLAAGACIFLCS